MNPHHNNHTRLLDFEPEREQFRDEVLASLRKSPRELPTKYLYDKRGSDLYEQICSLDEYYIPRTEAAIMNSNIDEIVRLLGTDVVLIEYGCGSCTKTRILLDHMPGLTSYIPIDISREQLATVAGELGQSYPGLEIIPVCADYTGSFILPVPEQPGHRRVVYFPGSSIGNFEPESTRSLLKNIAGICGRGGALLIGIDLKKDIDVLHRAYNDRQNVTAAFNLNLLTRINRELDGDFQVESFRHHAFYNADKGRVEMHLVSLKDQTVHLDGVNIYLKQDESIWTESSYKYDMDDFNRLAESTGFRVEKIWTDEKRWFSVQYLVAN